MYDRLRNRITLLSDDELLMMVNHDAHEYNDLAIDLAEAEIRQRGITEETRLEPDPIMTDFQHMSYLKGISGVYVLAIMLIDFVILITLIFAVLYLFELFSIPFQSGSLILAIIFLPCIYYVVLESKYGKTIGNRLTRTHVIKTNGQPITYQDAVMRFFYRLLSIITAGLFKLSFVNKNKETKTMTVFDKPVKVYSH